MNRRASGAILAALVCLLSQMDGTDATAQSAAPRLFQPWMPDWERTDILEIKKMSQPKAWLGALLSQVERSPGENKFTSLKAVSDQIVWLRLLQGFLAGYKEEGVHAQFLQPAGGLLIRWPVPIDQTGKLNREFRDRLESARREVDQIFRDRLRAQPYRGPLPVWIRYEEGETTGDRKRRTAGSTFGGALITLNLPGRQPAQAGDANRWAVPEQDIRELVDTARHEFVHFYINRMLGEENTNRLPRDFHEGCATSLTNSSTIERSEIRVTVTEGGTMVRWQTMVSAPEDYQRYHLQMKYLRLAYGDGQFFDFLRSVLSGSGLDASVKKYFGKDSWQELFPGDLSVSIVNRFVSGRCVLWFFAVFAGFAFPLVFWRRTRPWMIWRASRSLLERNPFERLSRMKLAGPGRKRPMAWMLLAAVIAAFAVDRYLRWTNSLDIDSPAVLLRTTLWIDLWVVSLVVIAFLASGAVSITFFHRLKKTAIQVFRESANANADNGIAILQKLREVNTVLQHLKRSKTVLRESRDFRNLRTEGRNTEDEARARIARDLRRMVAEQLERQDCDTACMACSRLAPEIAGQAPFQDALVVLSRHMLQRLLALPQDRDAQAEADKLLGMTKSVVRFMRSDERGIMARELHSLVEKLLEQHNWEAACLVCGRLASEMAGQAPFQDALAALSRHVFQNVVDVERDPDWQAKAGELLGGLKRVVRLTQSSERQTIAWELHSWVTERLQRHDYDAAVLACSLLSPELKGQVLFQNSLLALSQGLAQELLTASSGPGSKEETDRLLSILADILPHMSLRPD